MIKTKNGKVKIEGSVPDIMSDISIIIKSAKNSLTANGITEEIAKDYIQHAIKLGLASDEEMRDIMIEMLAKMKGDHVGE